MHKTGGVIAGGEQWSLIRHLCQTLKGTRLVFQRNKEWHPHYYELPMTLRHNQHTWPTTPVMAYKWVWLADRTTRHPSDSSSDYYWRFLRGFSNWDLIGSKVKVMCHSSNIIKGNAMQSVWIIALSLPMVSQSYPRAPSSHREKLSHSKCNIFNSVAKIHLSKLPVACRPVLFYRWFCGYYFTASFVVAFIL